MESHPRRQRALTATFAVSVLMSAGCQRPVAQRPEPRIVATVDGEAIYSFEIQHLLQRYRGQDPKPKELVELARSLLEGLVLNRVLLAEANRQQIKVSKEELTEMLGGAARGFRARDFNEMLQYNYLTPELLGDRAADRMRIERLVASNIDQPTPQGDADLLAYYEANQAEFQVPQQVRARQIVVRTQELAEELRERVRRGAEFEELARSHSIAPESTRGGDLGFFGRGIMPPIFDENCFNLEPGQVSETITSEYGYHLFQVVEARPAETVSFEEARADIASKLANQRRMQAASAFIEGLRKRAQVTVKTEEVARLLATEAG